jgi:hypothetical protein
MSDYNIHSHAEKRHLEFMTKHNLGTNKAAAVRAIKGPKHLDKEKTVENPHYKSSDVYHEAGAHARTVNKEVRDKLHKGYHEMSKKHPEELKHHILSTYIKGNAEHALPYAKVHGSGGHNKPAHATATDPSDNEMYHKIRNAHHLSFHKGGDSLIHVHAHESEKSKGHRVFGLQVKHNNGPLTNIKIGATP